MSYQILDPVLERWAGNHQLHIFTEYKDEEVRSIDVVSPAGKRFQIWLDPPTADGRTKVHAWDYRRKRESFEPDLKEEMGPGTISI